MFVLQSSRKDDESDDDVSEVSSKVRKPTGKAKKKTKKDKKRQHSCKGMKVIARCSFGDWCLLVVMRSKVV